MRKAAKSLVYCEASAPDSNQTTEAQTSAVFEQLFRCLVARGMSLNNILLSQIHFDEASPGAPGTAISGNNGGLSVRINTVLAAFQAQGWVSESSGIQLGFGNVSYLNSPGCGIVWNCHASLPVITSYARTSPGPKKTPRPVRTQESAGSETPTPGCWTAPG